MRLNKIKEEALHLSQEERAELAQKLLLSLDASSDNELAEEWLVVAQHRAKELDEGIVKPIPAAEVRKKAQALLR